MFWRKRKERPVWAERIELPNGAWFRVSRIVELRPEEGSRSLPQIGPRVVLGISQHDGRVLQHSVPCRDFATAQFVAKDIAYRLGWKSI